mmetsp:Transcript_26527/g.67492  ORF Transcript_26527/g.67492 Transcript_26527/m.67492 type:complete len:85 (+) Transcript_26527:572-826(+)
MILGPRAPHAALHVHKATLQSDPRPLCDPRPHPPRHPPALRRASRTAYAQLRAGLLSWTGASRGAAAATRSLLSRAWPAAAGGS